jgi:hypothetical protein
MAPLADRRPARAIKPGDTLVTAWKPYVPSDEQPWNLQRAAHLYRRAAFGGTWSELQAAVAAGPEATIDRLMQGGADKESFYAEARSTIASLLGLGGKEELPAWWLYVLMHSPHPLEEKLTLFWHGHFATSAAKVNDHSLMLAQNELLRKHALSSFRPLLHAAARDTAMLLWLDSSVNRKTRPNENFAREVMELFALGVGNYTERDIKEAARSFTGWEVKQNRFWFNQVQHDEGEKQVLGRRGKFDGDAVIDVLLDEPSAARFIVRKLYRYLVADDFPEATGDGAAGKGAAVDPAAAIAAHEALLEPLAADYRAHDYDTGRLVRTILSSNHFYSTRAMGRKIKSPVEFAVGLVRALGGHTNHYALADDLEALGQRVFYPPNVKGWNGGREWINAYTLLARQNLVAALVGERDGRYGDKMGLARSPSLAGCASDASLAERAVDLLATLQPPDSVTAELKKSAARRGDESESKRRARMIEMIASLPEFQLA